MTQQAIRPVILFVDDEPSFRISIEDGLSVHGHEFTVATASSGYEALAIMEVLEPKLVISDVRMPRMDGIELLLEARKRFPDTPVVLMSAYFTDDLEEKAHEFGAAAVLHKPVSLDDLLQSIHFVLSGEYQKVLEATAKKKATGSPFAGGVGAGTALLTELGGGGAPSPARPSFSVRAVLELMELDGRTCILSVRHPSGSVGRIWVHDGIAADGETTTEQGAKAVESIRSWDDVALTMLPYVPRSESAPRAPSAAPRDAAPDPATGPRRDLT